MAQQKLQKQAKSYKSLIDSQEVKEYSSVANDI